MTTNVVMVKTVRGGDGTAWIAGNTYAAADDFARGLIGRGEAYAADHSITDVVDASVSALAAVAAEAETTRNTDPRDRRKRRFLVIPSGSTAVQLARQNSIIEQVWLFNSATTSTVVTINDGATSIGIQAASAAIGPDVAGLGYFGDGYRPSGVATITTGTTVICIVQIIGDCAMKLKDSTGLATEPVATATSRVWYIDPIGGNNGNAGTSAAAPKQTLASLTLQSLDIILIKRGTAMALTAQYAPTTAARGIVYSTYGTSPDKPTISSTIDNTNAIIHQQEAFWIGVHFTNFTKLTGNTAATTTPNCVIFQALGQASFDSTHRGMSGGFYDCDWSDINGCSVVFDAGNPVNEANATADIAANRASGAELVAMIQCTHDGIGDDALIAKVRGVFEVAYCTIQNVSERTTTGDCVHVLWHNPTRGRGIHDNELNKRNRDTKQVVIIDAPAGDASGYVAIYRNRLLGYGDGTTYAGDGSDPGQSNKVVICDIECDFWGNYVEGTGTIFASGNVTANPRTSVSGNIFVIKKNQAGVSPIYQQGPDSDFSNNVVYCTQKAAAASGLTLITQNDGGTVQATNYRAFNNIVINAYEAFRFKYDSDATWNNNVFINCDRHYTNNAGALLAADSTDAVGDLSWLVDPAGGNFRPAIINLMSDGALSNTPSFDGRTTALGSVHIGAFAAP